MFEGPRMDDAARGANLPDSPVLGGSEDPEPISEFIVPVGEWSDGNGCTHELARLYFKEKI